MKQLSVLLLFGIFFVACKSGEESSDTPENILTKNKMVEIMVQVHLAEAALNLNLNDNKAGETKVYQDIFRKKNVSKNQYEESLKYYTEHPEKMVEIYDEVLNELSRMQAEVAGPVKDTVSVDPDSVDKRSQ